MTGKKTDHPCGRCAFYAGSIWKPVPSESVSFLKQGFSRKTLPSSQALFRQGDENRGIFCVSKGLIAIRALSADGASTLIRIAYPGDVIGYRSFLANRPHETEALALLPSRVCTVALRHADQVVQKNPMVLKSIASRCISEIDRNHERIIATATKSNKQRLADLLYRLMTEHGKSDGDWISMRLPLSRIDLADLIGVQPETLSRLIRRLQCDGSFQFSGRSVHVPATAFSVSPALLPLPPLSA
ncbi:Crp/Fnr family transcriptional regulator [Cognatishimia sp. WU-CL00825]|uniref:Crp/Fnr family transcriptional regulator n=1 Tax=Cognatishimia sp. WU-CL00825 TaxID=3127658 RepID=UPI0033656EFC